MKRTLALLVLAAVAAPAASAAVLVDKPLNLGATNWGYRSTSGDQQVAEDFTLSAPAQATLVRFSGWFFTTNATTGSFDILFFVDAGGLPATDPFSSLNTGPLTGVFQGIDPSLGGGSIYEWAAAIPAVTFAVPGTYWISIRDTVAGADFAWESGPPNGDRTVVYRLTDTGSWTGTDPGFSDTDAQAVRIEGEFTAAAVPEPATLALALAGLTGLALARRRSPG
jgi:hypothetical protein